MSKWQELENIVLEHEPDTRFGIIMHDNPDMDCIALGFGIKKIIEGMGFTYDNKRKDFNTYLLFSGKTDCQTKEFLENIGMYDNTYRFSSTSDVLYWNYEHRNKKDLEFLYPQYFNKFIFVDHHGMNCKWYREGKIKDNEISAIIDHHDCENVSGGELLDCRDVGAASSILIEYLNQGANQYLSDDNLQKIYNLIYLGINIDTNHLRFGATDFDFSMLTSIASKVNHSLTSEFYKRKGTKEFYNAKGKALYFRESNRPDKKVVGNDYSIISTIGTFVKNSRDAIPVVANEMLTEENIGTAYLFGFDEHFVEMSIRTYKTDMNYFELMNKFEGAKGGGRKNAGKLYIPTRYFCEREKLDDFKNNKESIEKDIMYELKRKLLE
ncbi:MAG: DHH family phosphoesterase [Nanobdellota archaeon]